MKTEAGSSRNASESDREPSAAPSRVWREGPFSCSSCGKVYKYKSRYDGHLRKGCGEVVGGVLGSQPVDIKPSVEIKSEPTESSLDEGHGDEDRRLPPSPGHRLELRPEPGVGPGDDGMVKRRRVESELGDQSVCVAPGRKTSAQSPVPHADYLSMIQISNVKSLVSSGDDFLPATEEAATSTGKGSEPEGSSPSSDSTGQGVAPRNKAGGNSRLIWRNTDKLTDKLSWRPWVQRWLRNCRHVRQKWPNSGRRAVCLPCGRRFGRNAALDQHVASVHCERFRYRCGSCSMSFKAWARLCRHVLQAHSVKIQRRSSPSPVVKARKCILKAKQEDTAKAECINDVKDASIGDGPLDLLIKDEPSPDSEMKKRAVHGSPHLCVLAMKDTLKGEEIVFDDRGADLPWHTSTQSEKMHTTLGGPGIANNEVSEEANLSCLLTQRTEELAAERRVTAAKLSALEESHKAEMASLRADVQRQVFELLAENQKLAEELAAARNLPALPTPRRQDASPVMTAPSTPPASGQSGKPKKQHPDMVIPELVPDRERKIRQLSDGRSDRYGCYLFQAAVGTKKYHTWCCNTNWSGTGGKWELPKNLQEYLLNTLAEKFPGFGDRETRMFIERINELLRKPRHILYI